MPTYEYHCTQCSYKGEIEQKITAAPLTCCPECKNESLVRGPGGGAGLVFKGSGFYCNDYASGSKSSKADSGASGPQGCAHNGCGCAPKNSKP